MLRPGVVGLISLVAVAVVANQGSSAARGKVSAPPSTEVPALFGGAFALVDHDGMGRTDRDFRGRFMLVFFGYTHCPNICGTGLATMATALDGLAGDARRVQPLFITVDPARDRPERLKSYVSRFHPRLIGLTGNEAQVRAAAKAYRVHRSKVLLPGAPPEDYLANHTSLTYLMGPDGKFVTLFPHGTEPEVMAAAIRRHMAAAPEAAATETGFAANSR